MVRTAAAAVTACHRHRRHRLVRLRSLTATYPAQLSLPQDGTGSFGPSQGCRVIPAESLLDYSREDGHPSDSPETTPRPSVQIGSTDCRPCQQVNNLLVYVAATT
jgi:hypothetical protein